jgi:4-hydroxy-3-polyprenylbenzoate decarboxylase
MRVGVAFTGASGLEYGFRLVEVLLENGHEVHVFASEAAAIVASKEMGKSLSPKHPEKAFSHLNNSDKLFGVPLTDIGGKNASGSSAVDALVVIPCSMSTLGRLASGVGGRSIERCAAVMLKENKTLIIVPRETPLSLIDLRNQVTLKEAGAHILPASPGFYNKPQSLQDIIDFIVQKVVSLLRLDIQLTPPWQG